MKTIIVPTDFSKNAGNALKYAIQLANKFGSNLHLIHAYELHSRAGMLMNIRDFIRKDAEKQLQQIIEHVRADMLYNTSLQAKAMQGDAIDIISAYADAHHADLIVMGTKGARGLKEVFLGSNTEGLLKETTKPVLAIPDEFSDYTLNKITFAIDSQVINQAKVLDPLIDLATAYEAKVAVLHIETEEATAVIDQGISIYLKALPHTIHLVQNNSISKGIEIFNQETNANLLCMIKRHRSFLEQLFHRSATDREAFRTEIPLLVLHDI